MLNKMYPDTIEVIKFHTLNHVFNLYISISL